MPTFTFSSGDDSQIWFATDGTHTYVNGDVDGELVADFQTQVNNTAGLLAPGDFVL